MRSLPNLMTKEKAHNLIKRALTKFYTQSWVINQLAPHKYLLYIAKFKLRVNLIGALTTNRSLFQLQNTRSH